MLSRRNNKANRNRNYNNKSKRGNRNRNYNNKNKRGKTRHWRDSYDYRQQYIAKNPGLFGKLYFCGYCGKAIWGAENMQVDHIVPPSRFSKKKYTKGALTVDTSYFAEGLNNSFNLVPACPECNRRKSNKLTAGYVAKGFGSKLAQKGVTTATSAVVAGACLAGWGANKAVRLAARPLRRGVPGTIKFLYVALIVLLVLAFVLFTKR